ncbi:MAG: Wzt carbohydrate-binding domain-containing protein, partial [Patescibacteria group bacterium]|nr:Wzt carbohydrate-binding domain-containing protein [Patescibacteria group bacterium]
TAPGNHQVRLKAVRILSEGQVTGTPKVDKDIEIQIDYWNLEKDKLWWIGIHVLNAIGHILFTNSNVATASISSNPAINKKYPIGLLRTKFIIPKLLLNPGQHSINLYINNDYGSFNILKKSDIISFNVLESNEIRKNYLGEWIGAIRPILRWETIQID